MLLEYIVICARAGVVQHGSLVDNSTTPLDLQDKLYSILLFMLPL